MVVVMMAVAAGFFAVLGALVVSNWLLFEGNRRGWWTRDDVDKLRRP
jgi:hypothetical protein